MSARGGREGETIFIVHRLLDEQLLDAEGRRCGRVDDIELRGNPPRITALLVGVGLYPRRLPRGLRRLARRWVGPETWGSNAVRVPWEEVDQIGATVRLRRKAEEMGLGEGDDPERWMVRRLPWN
ncbi:MAG: PRC-barrel domain-containing protein [Solirubrobacterales bacterium]